MKPLNLLKNRLLAACIMTATLGCSSLAIAETPPDFTVNFPTGIACNGFKLRVEGWNDGNYGLRETKDKFGITRTIEAGTGYVLRFTNWKSKKTFETKSNGTANHTTYNSDGTQTVALTGHNVVILYPTDSPPGPSTSLYMGEVVFTIDTAGNYFVHSVSGQSVDICAAVS